MRDHQLALVKDEVADECIDELGDALAELGGLAPKLLDRLRQAMGELHVLATEFAQQFRLVVPRHAHGGSLLNHRHDQAQHVGRIRAPVDEIS